MDEMELLRELRAGLPPARAEARANARWALTTRFEEATREPRGLRLAWPRRRARLLLGGAVACLLATLVLALGLPGGSSRVEPAAAAVLRQVAAVARTSDAPGVPLPALGQFLYTKTTVVELEGWTPDGNAGSKDAPRSFTPHVPNIYPDAPLASVPTIVEKWIDPDGTVRQRETLGKVKFFSADDQEEWEAAGSPPPASFAKATRTSSGDLVKEFVTRKWAPDGVLPDPARLPTTAPALRNAVEHGRVHSPWIFEPESLHPRTPSEGKVAIEIGRDGVIEDLFEILEKPTTTPQIRAAAFNALAEIPGIRVLRGVSDPLGRRGDAVTLVAVGSGHRHDFIFDPQTATLLAQGETIVNPDAADRDVPEGTAFRQTAYLESGIVDSSGDVPGEG